MGIESFHENIGRNLEENVWGVEDNQSGVGPFAVQVQVFHNTKGQGIGDVDSVRIS